MNLWCLVLIAAVAVNSLVTTINAKSTSNSVTEPFNMLLPPLADKTEDAAAAAKTGSKTTATTTSAPLLKKTTKATLKPLTNDVDKVAAALPELSIEALLPPLFEAKIEKAEKDNKQQTASGDVETTTVRSTTTTTTTKRSTTPRTTKAPKLTTTTAKSIAVVPAALALDALETEINDNPSEVTTKKSYEPKPTKKSYYQQQKEKAEAVSEPDYETISETNSIPQSVLRNIESVASRQVESRRQQAETQYRSSFENYSFDLYLGSTTPRPPKYGLPTITPFPHRLGR